MQVRLADIFGDNGMISVVICRPGEAGVWEIDTWLMSCRVLGRKVEHMVLREILEHARAAGIHKLIGTYRPTDRNKLVVDHYAKLGFTKMAEEESGLTRWELLVEGAEPESAPMKVVSQGFSDVQAGIARMSGFKYVESEVDQKLPRRDWILLPTAQSDYDYCPRRSLPSSWDCASDSWSGFIRLEHDCVVLNDPSTACAGFRTAVCWDKIAETSPH